MVAAEGVETRAQFPVSHMALFTSLWRMEVVALLELVEE